MKWRRILFWLALLAILTAVLVWQARERPQNRAPVPVAAPAAPKATPAAPVDLARHDGETIDFSSGQAVVKDASADKAANDQAAQEMETAAKDVTFAPTKPADAAKTPPAPPKQ